MFYQFFSIRKKFFTGKFLPGRFPVFSSAPLSFNFPFIFSFHSFPFFPSQEFPGIVDTDIPSFFDHCWDVSSKKEKMLRYKNTSTIKCILFPYIIVFTNISMRDLVTYHCLRHVFVNRNACLNVRLWIILCQLYLNI